MRRTGVVMIVSGLVLAACGGGTHSATGSASTSVSEARLRLGDGRYTTAPTKGSVFSCITQFSGGGAFRDGPWIDSSTKTWSTKTKITVQGSVTWDGKFAESTNNSTLTLIGNGLPTVATGVYPVAATDP